MESMQANTFILLKTELSVQKVGAFDKFTGREETIAIQIAAQQ